MPKLASASFISVITVPELDLMHGFSCAIFDQINQIRTDMQGQTVCVRVCEGGGRVSEGG